MLSYTFQITNEYTGESVVLTPCLTFDDSASSGYGIMLQQYPEFDASIKNEEINKYGQHGIWDSFSFYGKKTLNFQGMIKFPTLTKILQEQELIKRILSLPPQPVVGVNDGYVKISWTDYDGNDWYIRAKIEQDVYFTRPLSQRTYAEFNITLKAEDPYIYSEEEYSQTGLLGWRQGMAFPMIFVPIGVNVLYNNVIQIYQSGTVEAPAKYRLYGYAENPRMVRLDEEESSVSVISNFLSTDGWVGGTNDSEHFLVGDESRKLTSTNNVEDSMYLTGSFDLDYDNTYENTEYINYFDSLTNDGTMVAEGDTVDMVVDYSEKTEGNASIKFDIDVSASVSNYAGIYTKDMSSKDIRGYEEGYVQADVYIPDVTNITSIRLDIGSALGVNGQYYNCTTQDDGSALANGWNTVKAELLSMTRYGTGADYSAITFVGVRFNYSAGQGDMADCRIDNFKAIAPIKRHWIGLHVYIDNVDNMEVGDYTTGTNYIKFIETDGVDEFVLQFAEANATLRNGWNYLRMLKDQFDVIGAPSWNDITKIECKIKSKTGTTLNISFDKLRCKNITFDEKELKINTTISAGDYVEFDIAQGTIVNSAGADLSGYLDGDSEWFGAKPGDNSFMYESDYNPLVTWVYPTQRVDVFWRDTQI